MVSTICFVALVTTFFIAFGRGAVPRDQRHPWTVTGLFIDVARGARRLVDLQERNPMTPHKHRLYEVDAPPAKRHASSLTGLDHHVWSA